MMTSDSSSIQVPPAAYLKKRGEPSPHAGPSPLKRGEIGFVECSHDAPNQTEDDHVQLPSPLPARHPADRVYFPSPTDPVEEEGIPQRAPSSTSTKSTKKNVQSFQLTTFMSFSIQILVLGGTVVVWVHAAKLAKANHAPQNSAASSATFVHALFVMAVIVQLILLERRLFRLRAERYCCHPDEVSRHRRSPSSTESIISSAPWNRPPLPTYAAALTLTGAGTGDVEDHLIAVLPPPAYGNIRGSTLLLSGDSPSVIQPLSESSADRSSSEIQASIEENGVADRAKLSKETSHSSNLS